MFEYFSKMSRKLKFHLNLTITTGTLHEDQYTFLIISRSVLIRMRNVAEEIVQKFKTHLLCSISPPENRAVYEIMGTNIVVPKRAQMTIWRMRISRWIPKATDTHSEYVILTAFPQQQCLYGRASMLRYTYIACVVLL